MTWLTDALAVFRLTRLVARDDITAPLRARVNHAAQRSVDDPGVAAKIETLLNCPWCVSWWVAIGVLAARRTVPQAWDPLAMALAYSAITGLVSEAAV